MIRTAIWLSAALVAASVSGLPKASAQDVDAMAKWTAATIVHYRIVGEFKGKWTILKGKKLSRDAEVSDRLELEFDWDQTAYQFVRLPVIRNSPTTLGAIDAPRFPLMKGPCPAPRIDRQPEYLTVTSVSALSALVQLDVTRQLAGGALPDNGEAANAKCGEEWDPAAPVTTTVKESVTLPPAMALAMPGGLGNMKPSPDGKSLAMKGKEWTWTFTPTIVK